MSRFPEFIDPYDKSCANLFIRLEHLARYMFAAEFAGRRRIKRALDCACGDGYGCRELGKRVGYVTGVDANENLIEMAKKQGESKPDASPNYHVADLNAGLTMFETAAFDLVCCFETLEHVRNDRAMLLEFRRVLRPGGYLLLSVPKAGYEPMDEKGQPVNPFHLRLYEADELEPVLVDSGFAVERTLGQPFSNAARVRMEDYRRDTGVTEETISGFFNETPASLLLFSKLWAWPAEELQAKSTTLFMVCRRRR